MKMMLRKLKLRFGLQEQGILQISWILLDLQMALTIQLPDINAESSPFSIFILFFRQVFQIILTKTSRYFHQYMSSRATGSTSTQPPDITIEEIYNFLGLWFKWGMTRVTASKIIGPERSNTVYTDRTVFLQEMWRWSVHSGLLWDMRVDPKVSRLVPPSAQQLC